MGTSVYIAITVLALGWAFIDLMRTEVQHAPKWAWALVIAFFIFPIGLLVYLVVERSPLVGRD
jgi:hypothetical protein